MDYSLITKVVECFTLGSDTVRPMNQCSLFTAHKTEHLEHWYGEYWMFGALDEVAVELVARIDQIKLTYHSYSFHYDVYQRGDDEKHEFVVCFEDPNEAIQFRLKNNVKSLRSL